ncbi:hypothetical protein LK06_016215 [Streptomyces pluripotens]|nr:hypothetical protein LK06_016215 [Streptomyces pluripotens]
MFAAVCVVLAAAGHALASGARVPLWTLGVGFLCCLLLVVPLAGRTRSLPGIAALLALGQITLHTLFGLGQQAVALGTARSAGTAGSAGTAESAGVATGSSLNDTALVEQASRLLCGSSSASLTPGHAFRLLLDAHLIDRQGRPLTAMGSLQHARDTAADCCSALLPSLPMLLGHVLAAVTAGWLLRRGDLAVLRLIGLSAHGVAEAALVRSLRAALTLTHLLCTGLVPVAGPAAHGRRTASDDPPAPHTTALQHTVIRRGPPAGAFLLAA